MVYKEKSQKKHTFSIRKSFPTTLKYMLLLNNEAACFTTAVFDIATWCVPSDVIATWCVPSDANAIATWCVPPDANAIATWCVPSDANAIATWCVPSDVIATWTSSLFSKIKSG